MNRLLLPLFTLILALGAAAVAEPPAAAQKDDPEQPKEEPAAPETLGKVTLALNPGGHTATVTKVFFTPDSQQLITVALDHTIRIWDAGSGEALKVLYPPGFGGLGAAALSPDGKTLAVGSRYSDGDKILHLIYLVSLADGRIERVLKGHPQAIEALAFSADGKRLASTSPGKDGTVRIWNAATGAQEKAFPFTGDPLFRKTLRGLAFSPDGSRLARVRLSGGPGDILDLTTGKAVAKLKGIGSVAWSPDGKTLATPRTLPAGGGVILWNPDGTERLRLLGDDGGSTCHSLAFSADSRTLLATYGHTDWPQTGIFDVASGKQLVKSVAKFANGDGALSADGLLAATAANNGGGIHGLTVWKTADGTVVKRGKVWPAPSIFKVSNRTGWSADGKVVNWAGPGNRHTFNLATLAFAPPLKDFRGPVYKQGALSLEKLKVFKDGVHLATLKGYDPTLVGTDRAACTLPSGVIVLYEASTGKEVHRFHGHHDQLNDLVPSPPDGRFLLSTSMDQTLKVWSLERDKALLSLYVKGSDWIVWTPEGYYAATPGGERLMGWKVDNGIDKTPSFYPAERFRKQLYRPDVIGKLLEKGSVAEALKAADAALGRASREVKLEQLLPPRATLEVLHQSTPPQVKLRATASASAEGQPVTALRLLVDGRPLPAGAAHAEFKGQPNAQAEWSLTLPPGKHSLTVLARSPDASSVSEMVEVACPLLPRQAVLHVLAVGINNYQDPIPKLKFAAADAQAIANAFEKNCKGPLFPQVASKALVDAKATRAAILQNVDALRKGRVGANDLVVLFFAGHGIKEKDRFYLLTAETKIDDLAGTALSGEDLRKALGEFPCQVLLMLDACHSGAGLKNFRPAVDDATRLLSDDEVGVAVLCAAMGHEKALETKGHGLFTKAVVEALSQADGVPFNRRDRRLYVHHLHSYVLDEVQARSEDRQHPPLSLPSAGESFPITQFVLKTPPPR